jgi:glycosyltransferase involved in cell wall biosynthesis
VNVRAVVSGYPPVQGAGAEWYMHSVLRWLQARGHCVEVALTGKDAASYPDEYQGVPIDPLRQILADWPDVILSHLGGLPVARKMTKHAPLVHLNNNDWSHTHAPTAKLQVFNTHWVAKRAATKGVVVYPPVVYRDYAVKVRPKQGRITLINLMPEKGSGIFWALARRMDPQPFMAVKGGWGTQIIPSTLPGNVKLVENTPKMRRVYAETRLLLVPSDYESFGRVAVEAACSGIPVLASPTEGLLEAMGAEGAHWVRGGVDSWEIAIQAHLEGRLPEQGERGRARARELERITHDQLLDLEHELERIAG